MRNYKIAAMGGDGIGPEVVDAAVEALKVCAERDGGFKLEFQDFDWGSDYYKKHGVMMPEDGADQLRKFDAILFGAVGAPDIPDHITLWGLRLAICQPLDQYANVRPTRILPGITSPLRHVSGPELDWVIVRENSEGEYSGVGGRVHRGLPIEVAQDVSVMTRAWRAAHPPLRVQAGPVPAAQAPDGRDQEQRAAPCHGDVGRDRGRGREGVPGRDLGQDAGRCDDHADGDEAADARHDRRHEPPCGHPVRPGRGAGRLARHRADREHQPGAGRALDVRADPRLGVRHHRQRHRQSGRRRSGPPP